MMNAQCVLDSNMFIIYNIVNVINNKVYIGCSKNFPTRKREHLNKLVKNKHDNIYLQRSWNKYGRDNFKFEIFCVCTNEEVMYKLEILLIDNTSSIYNLASGGKGGNTTSHYTIKQKKLLSEKLSKVRKQVWKNGKMKNLGKFSNYSKERQKELKEIWSNCKKGELNSNFKYSHQILQKDINNNVIKIWNNSIEIRNHSDFNIKYVLHCCNKKKGYKTHKGYKWDFNNVMCEG